MLRSHGDIRCDLKLWEEIPCLVVTHYLCHQRNVLVITSLNMYASLLVFLLIVPKLVIERGALKIVFFLLDMIIHFGVDLSHMLMASGLAHDVIELLETVQGDSEIDKGPLGCVVG